LEYLARLVICMQSLTKGETKSRAPLHLTPFGKIIPLKAKKRNWAVRADAQTLLFLEGKRKSKPSNRNVIRTLKGGVAFSYVLQVPGQKGKNPGGGHRRATG